MEREFREKGDSTGHKPFGLGLVCYAAFPGIGGNLKICMRYPAVSAFEFVHRLKAAMWSP